MTSRRPSAEKVSVPRQKSARHGDAMAAHIEAATLRLLERNSTQPQVTAANVAALCTGAGMWSHRAAAPVRRVHDAIDTRSEERRVGKESRARRAQAE